MKKESLLKRLEKEIQGTLKTPPPILLFLGIVGWIVGSIMLAVLLAHLFLRVG